MNIDKHLLSVLVEAVREGMPDSLVSDVPAIIVYARKGDACTTVEMDTQMLEYLYRHGGVASVRQQMLDTARAHRETLGRITSEGRP